MGFDWRPTSQKGVRVYNVAGKWAGKKCKDTKSLRRGEENKELASFVNVFWKESSPEELIMFCCIPTHHVEFNFSRMNSPSPCPLCWSVQQLIKMRVTAMPKVAGCVTRSHFILLIQDYTVECKWLHPVWFLNVEKKKLSTKMYASKKIKVVLVFIMNEHTYNEWNFTTRWRNIGRMSRRINRGRNTEQVHTIGNKTNDKTGPKYRM